MAEFLGVSSIRLFGGDKLTKQGLPVSAMLRKQIPPNPSIFGAFN